METSEAWPLHQFDTISLGQYDFEYHSRLLHPFIARGACIEASDELGPEIPGALILFSGFFVSLLG